MCFFPFEWISMYSLRLMTQNVSSLVHFHLSVFICWGCNSLIHVLRGGTMLTSKGSWRKWLACILLFHFLFSLILQGILIFSRWVESQLFFAWQPKTNTKLSRRSSAILFLCRHSWWDGQNLTKFSQEDFLSSHNNKTDIFKLI